MPYLLSLLLDELKKQVVQLHAPAGFGKTELMAAGYRASAEKKAQRTAWLTFSPTHVDPAALLSDLSEALGAGRPAKSVDEVAATPWRIVAFLDGIDTADMRPAQDSLAQLFRSPPDNLRIAVATRGLFQLPLARLRLRGLVTEIGPERLAFTRTEIRRALSRITSSSDRESVTKLTQGWPALIQLDPDKGEPLGIAPKRRHSRTKAELPPARLLWCLPRSLADLTELRCVR